MDSNEARTFQRVESWLSPMSLVRLTLPLQPRQLMIAPAAVGCKRLLDHHRHRHESCMIRHNPMRMSKPAPNRVSVAPTRSKPHAR